MMSTWVMADERNEHEFLLRTRIEALIMLAGHASTMLHRVQPRPTSTMLHRVLPSGIAERGAGRISCGARHRALPSGIAPRGADRMSCGATHRTLSSGIAQRGAGGIPSGGTNKSTGALEFLGSGGEEKAGWKVPGSIFAMALVRKARERRNRTISLRDSKLVGRRNVLHGIPGLPPDVQIVSTFVIMRRVAGVKGMPKSKSRSPSTASM